MSNGKPERQATIIVDLGFGDCCKGSIVDFLARRRQAHTVIRFNGGGQAGHNVVTADGRHHTFSQFGSATFVPGVRTYLSRFMIVSPMAALTENEHLTQLGVNDALARTAVSDRSLVVTHFQWAANRLRELARGDGRHGSCGMGVGETTYDHIRLGSDSVFVGDLAGDPTALERKLRRLQEFKLADIAGVIAQCRGLTAAQSELDLLESRLTTEEVHIIYRQYPQAIRVVGDDYLQRLLAADGQVIFESAQGVLLDQDHGFHPYTTWSRCTPVNALNLLKENGYGGRVEKLGLLRAYATRHGPGPFVTESDYATATIPDRHNRLDPWQKNFRVGWLDLVSARYAIAAGGGVDGLAVSCLDRLKAMRTWPVCQAYRLPPAATASQAQRLMSDFNPETGLASGIKAVPQIGDRAYQQALTDLLLQAAPSHDTGIEGDDFDAKSRQMLARITADTGCQVRIASYGPTAQDKTFLP